MNVVKKQIQNSKPHARTGSDAKARSQQDVDGGRLEDARLDIFEIGS